MESPIVRALLKQLDQVNLTSQALVGLDGYIDKIQHPVQSINKSGKEFYATLDRFGHHIQGSAGKSTQVELHTQNIKLGGNAPIMAHALATLGVRNTCLGTFGDPQIDEIFRTIHSDCSLISVGKPAETNALEFNDGKLILSEVSAFDNLDWAFIKSMIKLEQLRQLSKQVDLIALVDWSNLPHATAIWQGVLAELLQPQQGNKPAVFFDLADPRKKSDQDIMEVLELINAFGKQTEVTLGLNENEAIQIYQLFCRDKKSSSKLNKLSEIGASIYQEMDIENLLIHPMDCCYLFNQSETIHLKGRIVQSPKVSTGGGDNFNAGFCFGQLAGLSSEDSMRIAMATSGAYVKHGRSPDLEELKAFLENG